MEKLKRWFTIKKEMKLQEYFKIVLNYRGHFIADTEHSIDRFKERTNLSVFVYEKLLKKAVNWIYNNHRESIEDRYIFRSKKYGFGIQLEWRKDRKSGMLQGFTATTLSDNEMHFFTKKDKEVFVENFVKQGYSLEESKKVIDRGYGIFEFEKELEREMNLIGYTLFVECGEVYHNFEMIEL